MDLLLSAEDIAETAILSSYKNEDGFLPIEVLINLFSSSLMPYSLEDIIESVKDSDKVVVDAEAKLIRPAIPVERKTIVLRDIPVGVTEDDIRGVFEGVGSIESVKPPVGNNW